MKDSIDNNLEFKLTLFAGLIGVWWWILDFASKFDLNKEGAFATYSFLIISFFVFYPLLNLVEMLVYIFLRQKDVEENKKMINKYNAASRRFFSWLALLFLIFPVTAFLFVFAQSEIIISIIVSLAYFVVVGYFFIKFFKRLDFGNKYYIPLLWLAGYAFIFIFVYAFARTFSKINFL
jgi:hypothetical protein